MTPRQQDLIRTSWAQVAPAVEALGRRHVGYGVRADHFITVGQALLDTRAVGLGEAFTLEVRRAWAVAYGIVSGVMQGAMEDAAA